jgi:hypothetical protein
MKKKTLSLAALAIAPMMALFLLSACSSKPKTEAERTVEFLRDLADEKVAEEFHPAYWERQCKENTQVWKTGLIICGDGGPHHWMCDVITTMQACQARSTAAN